MRRPRRRRLASEGGTTAANRSNACARHCAAARHACLPASSCQPQSKHRATTAQQTAGRTCDGLDKGAGRHHLDLGLVLLGHGGRCVTRGSRAGGTEVQRPAPAVSKGVASSGRMGQPRQLRCCPSSPFAACCCALPFPICPAPAAGRDWQHKHGSRRRWGRRSVCWRWRPTPAVVRRNAPGAGARALGAAACGRHGPPELVCTLRNAAQRAPPVSQGDPPCC